MNSSLVIHATRDNFQLYNAISVTNPQIHTRTPPHPHHIITLSTTLKLCPPAPSFRALHYECCRTLTVLCFSLIAVHFALNWFNLFDDTFLYLFISPTVCNLLLKNNPHA